MPSLGGMIRGGARAISGARRGRSVSGAVSGARTVRRSSGARSAMSTSAGRMVPGARPSSFAPQVPAVPAASTGRRRMSRGRMAAYGAGGIGAGVALTRTNTGPGASGRSSLYGPQGRVGQYY